MQVSEGVGRAPSEDKQPLAADETLDKEEEEEMVENDDESVLFFKEIKEYKESNPYYQNPIFKELEFDTAWNSSFLKYSPLLSEVIRTIFHSLTDEEPESLSDNSYRILSPS